MRESGREIMVWRSSPHHGPAAAGGPLLLGCGHPHPCPHGGSAGEHPPPPPAREEGKRPAHDPQDPVLEADQVEDVDPEPQQPGERAAEVDPLDLGDGAGASDRGEVALVDVAERLDGLAEHPPPHDLRGVAALLHRHGRDARQVLHVPLRVLHAHHVAEREHLRVAGQREVRLDGDAPGAIRLLPHGGRQAAGEARRRPPRRPPPPARREARRPAAHPTGRAAMRSVLPSGCWSWTPSASMSTTSAPTIGVTPRFSSWLTALWERSGGKAMSTRSPPSTSRIRPSAVSTAR